MKNKFIKTTNILLGLVFSMIANLLIFNSTYAQVSFPNPIKATDLRQLVKDILDVVVEFGAIVVVFFMVYAGFLFVKAQGDPGGLKKAKDTFFWTVVGGMIVLGAHVLSRVIKNTVDQIQG
jgi:hypothetical protein